MHNPRTKQLATQLKGEALEESLPQIERYRSRSLQNLRQFSVVEVEH